MKRTDTVSDVRRFPFDGPDVTWVGPFGNGYVVGFADGSVDFLDSNLVRVPNRTREIVSTEAINGVAFIGDGIAFSTRTEVTFFKDDGSPRSVFFGGAHGVVAMLGGFYVASLGIEGLLVAKPEPRMTSITRSVPNVYFYRIAAVGDGTGREFLLSANRRHGIGITEFKGIRDWPGFFLVGYEGLDVVDVCRVEAGSLAAIAISAKGDVVFLKDVSTRENPVTFSPPELEGEVYRVLATPQHLLVLTSKTLYFWRGLVANLLSGDHSIPFPLYRPMDAVDMTLGHDNELLLVMAENAIQILDLSKFEHSALSTGTLNSFEASGQFAQHWKNRELVQGFVGAA